MPFQQSRKESAQGAAVGFHIGTTVVLALGGFYIVNNHFFLSLLLGVSAFLYTQFPKYSRQIGYAALIIGAPILLFAAWDHWLLVMSAIITALVAYTYADEAVRDRLLFAATNLYEPVKQNVNLATENVKNVTLTAASKADDKLRKAAARRGGNIGGQGIAYHQQQGILSE